MVISLKLVMRVKEVFLKKLNKFLNRFCKYIIFFLCTNLYAANVQYDYKKIITEYILNINQLSSNFIQSSGNTIEEGTLYLKDKRVKIQYSYPAKIQIIIAKNKAMYFNEDLQEVQYFNPKDSLANFFYKVFFNQTFFDDAFFYEKENFITVEKEFFIDGEKLTILIFFENRPFVLRKIEVYQENNITVFSLINPNYNPDLNNKFFSMANPTIN